MQCNTLQSTDETTKVPLSTELLSVEHKPTKFEWIYFKAINIYILVKNGITFDVFMLYARYIFLVREPVQAAAVDYVQ